MPEVSIIIPVYKSEKYLARCLDSIIRQDFQDFEVICVNDCSPDKSEDILNEYATKHPDKIRVFKNPENQGSGKTRTNGLQRSEGRYIMFVDSDDHLKHDYIRTYVDAIRQEDGELVVGGYIRDVEGKHTEHKTSDSVWSVVTFPVVWAKIFSKSFLIDNNIYFDNLSMGEDVFFSLNVFHHVKKYKTIDYCGYYYFMNSQSLSRSTTHDKNFEKGVAEIFDLFMGGIDINAIPKEKRDVIEYTYLANMINALITHGHGGKIKSMRKKYAFFIEDLNKRFPDYKSNPHIGILKPKEQTLKIRMGVGVVMFLHKFGLDKALFYLISLL